jgi:hypothetical protein
MGNIFTEKVTKDMFDYFLSNRVDKIKHTLGVKAKEYARNGDVFHNPNTGSKLTGESREKYIMGLATKQIISVNDIIDDLIVGNYSTDAHIEEKFGDVINYFILGEISLKHRNMVRLNYSFKEDKKEMNVSDIEKTIKLDREVSELLRSSTERLGLSARAYHRIIKLSQTIADLENSTRISKQHILEALQYRQKSF